MIQFYLKTTHPITTGVLLCNFNKPIDKMYNVCKSVQNQSKVLFSIVLSSLRAPDGKLSV